MRIIAVCNQKGGAGKTTTAWAITTGAAIRGKKALAIDFDPQGSLTYVMNADPANLNIQHTKTGDILPASLSLVNLDDTSLLERIVTPLEGRYDVIVIDTPPTMGKAQIAALRACNEILIPTQPDSLCLQGLYLIRAAIREVNTNVNILGVFFAKYKGRTALARDLGQTIQAKCAEMGIPFLDTPIRDGIAIQEAQFMHEPIFTYSPRSNPAKDYGSLLDAIKI